MLKGASSGFISPVLKIDLVQVPKVLDLIFPFQWFFAFLS